MAKGAVGFVLGLLAVVGPTAEAELVGWPQQLAGDNGAVVIIYQPQVESFSGNSIEARAAISVKSPATENAPVFGAIWIEAKIDVDRDARTAVIRDVDIGDIRFADASGEQLQELTAFIERQVEGSRFSISVDQLLADLNAEIINAATEGQTDTLKNLIGGSSDAHSDARSALVSAAFSALERQADAHSCC